VLAVALPIVLNEVLYDPPGADAGLEYVEIAAVAAADSSASLAGWVLETGNGSAPGQWTVAWTGGPGDRLRGGLFLIGEAAVEPAPDVVADLDLQNGPDACRLRAPGGAMDVVGWGTPLGPEYFEGAPAADVSGVALARLPDGADTDDNAVDFLAADPTPGEFNAAEHAFVVEAFAAPAPGLPEGTAHEFAWDLRNVGRTAGAVTVRALCGVHPEEVLAEAATVALAPGARGAARAEAWPPAGTHLPRSDPEEPLPAEPAAWTGGGADVAVMEVMNRPAPGDPEWVELECVAAAAVDLAVVELRDASGAGGTVAEADPGNAGPSAAEGPSVLAPGALAVATADTAAFLARWGRPAGALLLETSPWPALNHTASGGAPAERVTLRIGGIEGDVAAIPAGADEGVSWERVSRHADGRSASAWAPCPDASGGTPGRRNTVSGDADAPTPGPGRLAVQPSPFRPGLDGAALIVLHPARAAPGCRMEIYDSRGVRVAGLATWTVGAEHRALWDGRTGDGGPAPLGLYVVRAELPGQPAVRGTLALVR
jgi:hypothetical protein